MDKADISAFLEALSEMVREFDPSNNEKRIPFFAGVKTLTRELREAAECGYPTGTISVILTELEESARGMAGLSPSSSTGFDNHRNYANVAISKLRYPTTFALER